MLGLEYGQEATSNIGLESVQKGIKLSDLCNDVEL